jgi:hypothetical protein
VSGRLDRAAAFFVAPANTPEPLRPAPPPRSARAVVLGVPRDVVPVAGALALALRAADRAPAGLVAVWSDAGLMKAGAATRAAARLASRLTARDMPAVARGRLAWLDLPVEPSAAAAAVRRASELVDGPLVTALAGARPPELETLVAEHDLAIVAADPGTPLARAAVADLRSRGLEAAAHRPLPRGLVRALAVAGLAAPRAGTTNGGDA